MPPPLLFLLSRLFLCRQLQLVPTYFSIDWQEVPVLPASSSKKYEVGDLSATRSCELHFEKLIFT